MTPNPRLAARYAKSILDLAIERSQLEVVYSDMLFLQSVCRMSKEFVNMLRSPIIKADKKGKVLDAITAGKVSPLTVAFYKLLLAKERESHLPEIATAFVAQYKAYKGIEIVKLTTAVPIGEEVKQEILARIKDGHDLQHIELDTAVRAELIGGFILEIGDRMIDASVAHELHDIKQQFENNDFIYKIR
jgi:F-type H+-transporting ATPase subunit delta